MKTSKQMERHLKGVANHHRIDILFQIFNQPKITLWDIADRLNANRKTISQHTRYLQQAGLVNKKYKGRQVQHELSPYGKIFLKFLNNFKKIK